MILLFILRCQFINAHRLILCLMDTWILFGRIADPRHNIAVDGMHTACSLISDT